MCRYILLTLLTLIFLPALLAADVATIRETTGSNASQIQATVGAFRTDLGSSNNGNAVGSQGGGRRQITWDGGDSVSAPALLPGDFFNAVAPRGAIVTGPDGRTQFSISADGVGNNATNTPEDFSNLNASYTKAFGVFSSPRLFTATNSNVLNVTF